MAYERKMQCSLVVVFLHQLKVVFFKSEKSSWCAAFVILRLSFLSCKKKKEAKLMDVMP